MKRACPCCGYLTLDDPNPGSFELCPICYWEDDSDQLADPDYEGGANPSSLRQSQKNFADFGACEPSMKCNVRPIVETDRRDAGWAPIPPLQHRPSRASIVGGMDPLLDNLIERFRRAQDAAVAFLIDVARVPWPESNFHWAADFYDCCRKAQLPVGAQLKPHGYGVEVIPDGLRLDFDWGDEGEPDGFDGWRLYYFALHSRPKIDCTHNQLNGMLDKAFRDGLLIRDRLLYYDPNRRSCRQRS